MELNTARERERGAMLEKTNRLIVLYLKMTLNTIGNLYVFLGSLVLLDFDCMCVCVVAI